MAKQTSKRAQRTDPHRPGAIIPADYEHLISYALPTSSGGFPIPSMSVDCVRERGSYLGPDGKTYGYFNAPSGSTYVPGEHGTGDMCCVMRAMERNPFFDLGGLGKCSVCGAAFTYGDVWRHTPTGECIHLGHTCVAKYEMLADRSAFELERGRMKDAAAKAIQRAQNAEARTAFLEKHPGLADALAMDHAIIKDIAARFQEWCTISDKQIALVFKLADEIRNPKAAEKNVPAPVGRRVDFEGTIVSCKAQEGSFGTSYKITVKVQAEGGTWLAWGTCPRELMDTVGVRGGIRGAVVALCATLKAGRDPHFAIMDRPSLFKLISEPAHNAHPRNREGRKITEWQCACGKLCNDASAHTDSGLYANDFEPETKPEPVNPFRGVGVAFGFFSDKRWIDMSETVKSRKDQNECVSMGAKPSDDGKSTHAFTLRLLCTHPTRVLGAPAT